MPAASTSNLALPTPAALEPTQPAAASAASVNFSDLTPVAGDYLFAEGPAADALGNVYFSDINAGKIYKWSPDGQVSVFMAGLNKPNGLAFDANGNLIACEGGAGRLISIDPQGQITILADQYNGARFNEPNDLWVDPQGGIYFTDPAYQSPVVQDGQHVYYLSPDRSQVTRVIDDFVRPNGIVGTADGQQLYVADHGAGQTFVYTVEANGVLADRRLFAAAGSDGIALDAAGNVYLTNPVQIYAPSGKFLQDIPTTQNPTNVVFGGADGQTLFITARTEVYITQAALPGAASTSSSTGFALTSPDVTEGGVLPAEYTCDGSSSTLALNWSGVPEGTVSYALIMHHVAGPDDVHWYWVMYNIPANISGLEKNSMGVGVLGINSVNDRTEYTPPCSKGPGAKNYTYTVYALSAEPQLNIPASQVTRAVLLDAIQNITLDSAELNVTYTRK